MKSGVRKQKPFSSKVNKRLTEAANAVMRGDPVGGMDQSLVGTIVKVGHQEGVVMSQWSEGGHTIITVKVGP